MNKKVILAILTAGLICTSYLTGCSNTAAPERTVSESTIENEPERAHYTFVEHSQSKPTKIMSEDQETLFILSSAEKVSFVAESRADREASRKINNTLGEAYDRAKALYTNFYEDLNEILSQETPDLSLLPFETKVDYTCTRNDGRAISVTEIIETYVAGNLEGTTRYVYNFDPVTGDQIKNIFYTTGDKASFDEADNTIYEKLLAKYGEEVINYSNVSTSFIDETLDSWRFTENGVVVTINAGYVAPAEAGVLEVEYTKDELPAFAQKYFN